MKYSIAIISTAALILLNSAVQHISGDLSGQICGDWIIDAERSASVIGELYLQYGSSLREYGAGISIGADGSFSFYIGLSGGEGTYEYVGGVIYADTVSYNGGTASRERFRVMREGTDIYLIYNVPASPESFDIVWKKK